jgi:hypothetical protein
MHTEGGKKGGSWHTVPYYHMPWLDSQRPAGLTSLPNVQAEPHMSRDTCTSTSLVPSLSFFYINNCWHDISTDVNFPRLRFTIQCFAF